MNNPTPNYFVVNRALLNSERWLSEKFTRGQAWVDLFGLAQHSDSWVRIRGIKVQVRRGQLAYSQLTLSKRWGWSRCKTRKYLNELENDGDIEQQNNEVTTLITIKKYNIWQGSEQQTEQQKDNRKTTERTHTINEKNDKNEKKEYDADEIGKLKTNNVHAWSVLSAFLEKGYKPNEPLDNFVEWWDREMNDFIAIAKSRGVQPEAGFLNTQLKKWKNHYDGSDKKHTVVRHKQSFINWLMNTFKFEKR